MITWADKEDWRVSPLAEKFKLTAGNANEIKNSINALEAIFNTDDIEFISSLSQLPAAVDGVVPVNKLYVVTKSIDFLGARVEGSGGFFGFSPEKIILTSTGLVGNPFLTFTGNAVMNGITIKGMDKGFYINTPGAAFDWTRTNFENCVESGEVGDCLFFITDTMAFINSSRLRFTGTINSFVASPNCIWRSLDANILESQIIFASTFTATGRVRIQDTQINTLAGQTGITFEPGATVPDENFICDKVRFSTVGTPLNGINGDNIKASFDGCQGLNVINTRPNAYYTMNGNAVPTIIATPDVPTKILGTTIQQEPTQRYVCTNNRATYIGASTQPASIDAILSVISGNNHQIGVYIYKYTAATNTGALILHSEAYDTTQGNGRAENMTIQTETNMSTGDYIEVWVENKNFTTSVTSESLSVRIK